MRRFLPVLLAAASAFALPVHASDHNDAARRQASDTLMADYHGQGPGAALLILKNGQVLHARGYGLADLDSRQAVDGRTNFRLASVSKQFTAMAVLLLEHDGVLGLDDPLARWLPGLPDAAQQRIRFHGGVYAESLPFPDASFDLAVSQYGIEYTRHGASIAELARTLRPGGRCAFVLHHAGSHLHAVAADEAAAARILLDGDGLLGHAASLLPYLALAAEGQVERLRADPAANQARAAFNAAAQAVGRSADSLRHPQLLLDAQQWVVEMTNAVVQRRAGAGEASARLAEYRQDIELAGLRSQELCSHALDEAGFERFSALLGATGMSGVSGAPLWHRDYLVGWQLRARRN